MLKNPDFQKVRELLLERVSPIDSQGVSLEECYGRILAQALIAQENIPSFDRSPYDGYALRAEDTQQASAEQPVCLQITEEIPAGKVATVPVTKGTAAKVLTGSPIPEGADTVVMFEKTSFTTDTVTLFAPLHQGDNIVRAGEDVLAGTVLAPKGTVIDPGVAGSLAAQGIVKPQVYRKPKIGLLSTGTELVEPNQTPAPGKIRNSNRYMLEAALKKWGFEPLYLGCAGDDEEEIAALLQTGLESCDALISTGGVSVGDYDFTTAALERIGSEILFQGVDMKPGMACAYALCQGKLLCALSGNPASSLTNFYTVALPALKKLAGYRDPLPQEISLRTADRFKKKSPKTRFLRGKLELRDGQLWIHLPQDQGNVVLSSSIGCDVMAVVPAGSGPVEEGTILKGFMI